MKEHAITKNCESNEFVIFAKTTKIGTHKNKANHSNEKKK